MSSLAIVVSGSGVDLALPPAADFAGFFFSLLSAKQHLYVHKPLNAQMICQIFCIRVSKDA